MGTGVMVGAGIFALTGQIAELAGALFPLAFLAGGAVAALGAYSYVKVTRANPSAGGIAMILSDAYGRRTVAAGSAMLMALSMVLNEALVARTFGTYLLAPFGVSGSAWLIPVLAVALIAGAVAINLARNESITTFQTVGAVIKVGGIGLLGIAALWGAGWGFKAGESGMAAETSAGGFMAATALAVLAYKGFTTITNSGGELKEPSRNVGRAIWISLAVCGVVYLLVSLGAGSSLTVQEIVGARDYSLAEASRPVLGQFGVIATVAVAVVATITGLIASMFALSRMLTMVTDMNMVPHRHLGMPGQVRHHLLVYIGVIAAVLAVTLDLSRIASVGIIFYLVTDIAIHWGVLRHLHRKVGAKRGVVGAAMAVDAVALAAFVVVRASSDPWFIAGSVAAVLAVFALEGLYLRRNPQHRLHA